MKTHKLPMRRCIACGISRPKQELLRIVTEDTGAVFDATGKKNGRGAYLCRSLECIKLAKKKKQISQDLFDELMKE